MHGLKGLRPVHQEPQATRVENRLLRLQLFFFGVDSSFFSIYIDPRRATTGLEILGLKLGVCMLGATIASGNRLRLRLLLALLATAR